MPSVSDGYVRAMSDTQEQKRAAVGIRLQRAMNARGWSPRDLGERLEKKGVRGANHVSIYRYARGERTPSVEFLTAAAEELQVRAQWLADGTPPMSGSDELADEIRQRVNAAAAMFWPHTSEAALASFHRVLGKILQADPSEAVEDEDVVKLASLLALLVFIPVGAIRTTRPPNWPSDEQFDDYSVAMLSALQLLPPEPGQGVTVEELLQSWEGWIATLRR